MPMSAAAGALRTIISAQAAQRWQAIDPLLPAPGNLPSGCGAEFIVAGADGQLAAYGTCEHWEGEPGTLELAWGAARRFRLTTQIAGPDVANALDQLLSLWRDHLAGVPGTDGEDTAAVVSWPSRDIDGVAALRRHGLTPMIVFAARATPAGPPRPRRPDPAESMVPASGTAAGGVRIRRAGADDIEVVTHLGMEVFRYDARFGGVIERPGTAEAMRCEAAALLAGPRAWTWLAERDGKAVGMLTAHKPESAGSLAPLVRPAPAAYLFLAFIRAEERGSGIGTALVTELHREIDSAAVAVTLVDYEQANPLSVPFWSQHGYRPLWASWEARPARAIR
jgi:GNAT superfamily N-acetyltransferase